MSAWVDANKRLPDHNGIVEIACFIRDNNPPFWELSHAWYLQGDRTIPSQWVRKGGENWPVEFWREATRDLVEEHPWDSLASRRVDPATISFYDQPDPIPNDNRVPIVDLVADDLAERKRKGIEKYGIPLKAFNGRNSMIDAYQEALDLCIYLRQVIEELGASQQREPQ